MYASISRSGIPERINTERISDKSIACCLATAFAAFAATISSALRSKPNDLPPAPAAASPAAEPAPVPAAEPAADAPAAGLPALKTGGSITSFVHQGISSQVLLSDPRTEP